MKFQKTLEEESKKYQNSLFLNYNEGKQLIKIYSNDLTKYEIFEIKFLEYINRNVTRIKNFYQYRKKMLEDCMLQPGKMTIQELNDLYNKWIILFEELTLNHTALYKITKKYDKYALNKLQNLIMDQYKRTKFIFYFIDLNYDDLLFRFSRMYHPESTENREKTTEIKRKTIKYLYLPSNDYKIELFLAKYVQINVFRNIPIIKQPVISIYYDSSDLNLYHTRIQKENQSYLIRTRWYMNRGTESNEDFSYFVEKKIHYEDIDSYTSVKKRTMLYHDNKKIPINITDDPILDGVEIHQEIMNDIMKGSLSPKVRVMYSRTAFEAGDIRLTLDSNLTYQKCHDEIFYHDETQKVIFPYCILEVKLESEKTYAFIDELIDKNLIIYMPKFSKYINGCSKFFPKIVNLNPYWKNGLPNFPLNEVDDGNKTIIPLANNFNLIVSNEKLFISINNYASRIITSAFFLLYEEKLLLFGCLSLIYGIYLNIFAYIQYLRQDQYIREKNIRLYDNKYGYHFMQLLESILLCCMGYLFYLKYIGMSCM